MIFFSVFGDSRKGQIQNFYPGPTHITATLPCGRCCKAQNEQLASENGSKTQWQQVQPAGCCACRLRENVLLTSKVMDSCTLQEHVPHLSSTVVGHTKTASVEMRSSFVRENEILRLSSYFSERSETGVNPASLCRASSVSFLRKFKF